MSKFCSIFILFSSCFVVFCWKDIGPGLTVGYQFAPSFNGKPFFKFIEGDNVMCMEAETQEPYFVRPAVFSENKEKIHGIQLCIHKKGGESQPASFPVNLDNESEVYRYMLYQYITKFPRNAMAPRFKSNSTVDKHHVPVCLDKYGQYMRRFEMVPYCQFYKEYNYDEITGMSKIEEHIGPDYQEVRSESYGYQRSGCYTESEGVYKTYFTCTCYGNDQTLCRKPIEKKQLVCGYYPENIVFRDALQSYVVGSTCMVQITYRNGEIDVQLHTSAAPSNQPFYFQYDPKSWCSLSIYRENLDEEIYVFCKTGDFCNNDWYVKNIKAESLSEDGFRCDHTSNLLAVIQQSCYLFHDYEYNQTVVLNDFVYKNISVANKDETLAYLVSVVTRDDDCIFEKLYMNNSTLHFFHLYRCTDRNCDNIDNAKNDGWKQDFDEQVFKCETINYISKESSFENVDKFKNILMENMTLETGGMCYIQISESGGIINVTSGTIKTLENLSICGEVEKSYAFSPDMNYTDVDNTLTCCTILLRNQQTDSNCTIDKMINFWNHKKTIQSIIKKSLIDGNALACERKNRRDEDCEALGGCYSTRQLDSEASPSSGCIDKIDEKIITSSNMAEYGLVCLASQAANKCIAVNSMMSMKDPMIVCCCNKPTVVRTNGAFKGYTCDTNVDDLSENMDIKSRTVLLTYLVRLASTAYNEMISSKCYIVTFVLLVSFCNLVAGYQRFLIPQEKLGAFDALEYPSKENCTDFMSNETTFYRAIIDSHRSKNYSLWYCVDASSVYNDNLRELYFTMLHHYVTKLPRSIVSPKPPKMQLQNGVQCQDVYGRPTRIFENRGHCYYRNRFVYDQSTSTFVASSSYSGPYLLKKDFEVEPAKLKVNDNLDDMTIRANCDKAEVCKKYAERNNQKLICGFKKETKLSDDKLIENIFRNECHFKLICNVTHIYRRFPDISENHSSYEPLNWCSSIEARKNYAESVTYTCDNEDLCNFQMAKKYEVQIHKSNLTCKYSSGLMSLLEESCSLFLDMKTKRMVVFPSIPETDVYDIVTKFNSSEENCRYLIAIIKRSDDQDCIPKLYEADENKLQFFHHCQCNTMNCDDNELLPAMKKDKANISCESADYQKPDYSYDHIEQYKKEIKSNQVPGGICYVSVSDKGRTLNVKAFAIDQKDKIRELCGVDADNLQLSPESSSKNSFSCCTVVMSNSQSESNCTIDKMLNLWYEDQKSKQDIDKILTKGDVLSCEKRDGRLDLCSYIDGCYSIRGLDDKTQAFGACIDRTDEIIIANTSELAEYGLACLTEEAAGQCLMVMPHMDEANEPLIVCCCNTPLVISPSTNAFKQYSCSTEADMEDIPETMDTKVSEYKNR